ncbi:MAG: NADH-quinone oxidoreductase subunit A [Candidatus Binataceae bacterium]
MTTWFPVAIVLIVSGLVVGGMVMASRLLGPRPAHNDVKGEAFECGNPASGSAWGRFSVRFYLTALLFLVFDVEIVFLYPWAMELRELGMFGFVEVLIFVAVMFVGLVYAWQRGAFDWE